MSETPHGGEIVGPVFRPGNPVADAAGSIHDDAVARQLGFEGGTIPGDALMDLYPAFLAQTYGKSWFEQGTLSLYFRQALEGGDPVRPVVGPLDNPSNSSPPRATRLETPDGRTIAQGTVSLGDSELPSALFARDLRAVPADQLRILEQMVPGEEITIQGVELPAAQQRERLKRGFGAGLSDVGEAEAEIARWHEDESPWGGAVALPSTAIGLLLYHGPRMALTPRIGDSVGLFGAIELNYRDGPILLDRSYDVQATVVALSESPKTEALWFDSVATLAGDPTRVIASMRMMLRFMKASSPLY